MTLQKLACFVQVAECLNFSEAAQRMHITQPSLSRQIVSLEQELGVQLFERNTRKVTLTPAGRELAKEAREVIRRSNNLQTLARRLSHGYVGRVNVGYSSAMDGSFMSSFLSESATYQPQLELSLHRLNQGRLITSLKGGEVDVAFLFRNGLVERSGLKVISVARSRLSLILPENHELANRRSIPIAELAGLPLSIMDRSESAAAHDHFLALCQRHGIVPDITQFCDDPQILILNVVAGKGGAILPVTVGDRISYGLLAVPLQSGEDLITEDVVAAYNGDFQSEALAIFLSWVRRFAVRHESPWEE